MEAPSVGCISLTHQLAVHEVLLLQCSVTDSPANTRKVVGQCCISICKIRKSHTKVYTLFQQNKKTTKEQLGCRYFFAKCSLLSRKILVNAKYRIGTRYRQILNIKRTWIRIGTSLVTLHYMQCETNQQHGVVQ